MGCSYYDLEDDLLPSLSREGVARAAAVVAATAAAVFLLI